MASDSRDPQTAEPVDPAPPVSPKLPGTPRAAEDPPEDDYPKPAGFDTDGDGIEVSS